MVPCSHCVAIRNEFGTVPPRSAIAVKCFDSKSILTRHRGLRLLMQSDPPATTPTATHCQPPHRARPSGVACHEPERHRPLELTSVTQSWGHMHIARGIAYDKHRSRLRTSSRAWRTSDSYSGVSPPCEPGFSTRAVVSST